MSPPPTNFNLSLSTAFPSLESKTNDNTVIGRQDMSHFLAQSMSMPLTSDHIYRPLTSSSFPSIANLTLPIFASSTTTEVQSTPLDRPRKLSREQIYEQIGSLICKVQTTAGTATGFFINDGTLAVPFHVVSLDIIDNQTVLFEPALCFYGSKVYTAQYCCDFPPESTISLDCAIFKIIDADFNFTSMRFFEKPLKPGRKVYFGGFPLVQNDPTFHSGIISSVPTSTEISYFTIDGTVVPGNSGGPVFVLENNELQLAGYISHQVADLNPEFVRSREKIQAELQHATVRISGVNLNVVLSEILNTVFDNLSTGIGSAVHVKHLQQLLRKETITSTMLSRGLPVKHGALKIEKKSEEQLEKAIKREIYNDVILFFFNLLKSTPQKADFYSKIDGAYGTIYRGDEWRLDRQAKPEDGSANLQVQVGNQTVATLLIDPVLLQFGREPHKIAEVANYVAFQFTHALKYAQRTGNAAVFAVHPK